MNSIGRVQLVRRHNPVLTALDPKSPLSVGNGEFAFTADVTGLQTFDEPYLKTIPLCTLSQWGWHSAPRPADLPPLRLTDYDSPGRTVAAGSRRRLGPSRSTSDDPTARRRPLRAVRTPPRRRSLRRFPRLVRRHAAAAQRARMGAHAAPRLKPLLPLVRIRAGRGQT